MILIGSGPTVEMIDPVRMISNRSSGAMGRSLVEAFREKGQSCYLVEGPTAYPEPQAGEGERVQSTLDMLEALRHQMGSCRFLLMVAAVCDFRATEVRSTKIKRDGEGWSLPLVPNPDVIATLKEEFPDVPAVVFALEDELDKAKALEKMKRKKAQYIVLNTPLSLASDDFSGYLLSDDLEIKLEGSKSEVAKKLADILLERLL